MKPIVFDTVIDKTPYQFEVIKVGHQYQATALRFLHFYEIAFEDTEERSILRLVRKIEDRNLPF